MDLAEMLNAVGASPLWLALYAAIVSTTALFWNIFRDLRVFQLRHKTTVSLMRTMPGDDTVIYLATVNLSLQRPIHVVAVEGYTRWWAPWSVRILECVAALLRLSLPARKQIGTLVDPGAFIVIPQGPMPRVLAPFLQEQVLIPFDPAKRWEETRWLGLRTAEGRRLWASRASTRMFVESVRNWGSGAGHTTA